MTEENTVQEEAFQDKPDDSAGLDEPAQELEDEQAGKSLVRYGEEPGFFRKYVCSIIAPLSAVMACGLAGWLYYKQEEGHKAIETEYSQRVATLSKEITTEKIARENLEKKLSREIKGADAEATQMQELESRIKNYADKGDNNTKQYADKKVENSAENAVNMARNYTNEQIGKLLAHVREATAQALADARAYSLIKYGELRDSVDKLGRDIGNQIKALESQVSAAFAAAKPAEKPVATRQRKETPLMSLNDLKNEFEARKAEYEDNIAGASTFDAYYTKAQNIWNSNLPEIEQRRMLSDLRVSFGIEETRNGFFESYMEILGRASSGGKKVK